MPQHRTQCGVNSLHLQSNGWRQARHMSVNVIKSAPPSNSSTSKRIFNFSNTPSNRAAKQCTPPASWQQKGGLGTLARLSSQCQSCPTPAALLIYKTPVGRGAATATTGPASAATSAAAPSTAKQSTPDISFRIIFTSSTDFLLQLSCKWG